MIGPDELSDDDFNSLDSLTIDEMLSDEARDDLELTLVTPVPVRCVVWGCSFNPMQRYCRFCGTEKTLLDVAYDRLRARCVETTV